MFNKLLSFFYNNETDLKSEGIPDDDIHSDSLAAITYFIKRDTKEALIDVQINDYDNESIEALCSLLDILGNDRAYIDTINMIKTSLLNDHQEEILVKIISKIGLHIKNKIMKPYNNDGEDEKDEPCIKPSDML